MVSIFIFSPRWINIRVDNNDPSCRCEGIHACRRRRVFHRGMAVKAAQAAAGRATEVDIFETYLADLCRNTSRFSLRLSPCLDWSPSQHIQRTPQPGYLNGKLSRKVKVRGVPLHGQLTEKCKMQSRRIDKPQCLSLPSFRW